VSLRVTVHTTWNTVPGEAWDRLCAGATPFLESGWQANLERSGAAVPDTGWSPRIVTVEDGTDLVAGAPAWHVTHDDGQWVYTGHWASAAEKAGLPLLPKLLLAVPFTPVPGDRWRIDATRDEIRRRKALLDGIQRAAEGCTSIHALFPEPPLGLPGAFLREQFVYRWLNRGYRSWEDWVGTLRSDRRKEMRRDRREVAGFSFEIRPDPDEATLDLLWRVYADTADRYDQEVPYLNRAFYLGLSDWKGRVFAVVARRHGREVGAALMVYNGRRLYGRTWGLLEPAPFVHFELCYHQGIELAIQLGADAYDPGYGGEQKLRRGFEPVKTWSEHRFSHPGLQRAFAAAAPREAAYVEHAMAEARRSLPYREEDP
jgi:hypothetical protein